MTVNVARSGVDGKTPYELRCGRKWRKRLRNMAKSASGYRWENATRVPRLLGRMGVFLTMLNGGVGSDVYLIGTPQGVKKARAFKQMPGPFCWDVEFYLAVVESPWDWDGPTTAALRVVITNVAVPLTMPDAGAPAQPRRVYIRRHIELL